MTIKVKIPNPRKISSLESKLTFINIIIEQLHFAQIVMLCIVCFVLMIFNAMCFLSYIYNMYKYKLHTFTINFIHHMHNLLIKHRK
jgi:hypothetical protein